jgi:hypothetical protein
MSEEFDHTKGIITLVFGILSILFCGCGFILGPIGLFLSSKYQAECIVAGVEPESLGKIGKILSMIGTAIGVLYLLLGCLYFVFMVVLAGMM